MRSARVLSFFLELGALSLVFGLSAQTLHRRCPPPQMGGLTGLPRIPTKALKLTKKWNPSCEYSERIATLVRSNRAQNSTASCRVACGIWYVEPDTWRVVSGIWHLAPGTWHAKHLAPGTWHAADPIRTRCAQWRDLETLYGNEEIAGLGGGRTTIEQGRYVDSGISTTKFRGFTYNVGHHVEEA